MITSKLPLSLQMLSTAILLVDESMKIAYLNFSAEALLSQSLKRVTGLSLNELVISGDLDEERLSLCFRSKGAWQIADASIITLQNQWQGCHISISHQTIDGLSYLLIEVMFLSEQRPIKREYQLIDQNKVSLSMVRNLAHEIKNPLSGLRGAAQLLSKKIDQRFKAYTDIIVAEADRLQKLVDRMLTPAKVESKHSINIHEITERVIEFFALSNENQLTFKRDYDPSLPEMVLAEEQIYQALLNLVTNAKEALNDNGTILIKTRAVHRQSIGPKQFRLMARLDVIDNGTGISDELKDVIFFPTISGKQSSGLGLGIAQTLVRQNDGIIEYQSEPGKTCFSIFLPITRVSHD